VAVKVSRFSTKAAVKLLVLFCAGMLKLMDSHPVKASMTKARHEADKKWKRFMGSSF
jgi:hypothetical protein